MSVDIDELMARIATLEAERDALLEASKPLSAKGRKEERRVSTALAATEKKIRRLTYECDRLRRSSDASPHKKNARAFSIYRAGLVGMAMSPIPIGYGYATANDTTRWVETVCSAREIVASDGEDLGTVSIPELRPEWQIDSTEGKAGPCWIPVPATNHVMGRFSKPERARLKRWEQVGPAPRVLSVLMLWVSIALLYVADAMRRGVKLLPDQRDEA